jgi:hypothetical protein
VGDEGAPFTPPPDADKVWRVVRQGELWLPRASCATACRPNATPSWAGASTLLALARRFDERGAAGVAAGHRRLAARPAWPPALAGSGWATIPAACGFATWRPARSLEGLTSAVAQGLQVPLGQEDPVADRPGHRRARALPGHPGQLRAPGAPGRGHAGPLARPRGRRHVFLVTTREVLGIAGEETLALAPLPAADAQALFTRRAAAAKRDFAPGPEDEAAIAHAGQAAGRPAAGHRAGRRARAHAATARACWRA